MKTPASYISKIFFYTCVFISCAPLLLLLVLTVSVFWPYPQLFPERVSLDYYRLVFGNTHTVRAITTTMSLGLLVSLLSLAIAIPAAKALALYNFYGKRFVKVLVLVPLVVPGIAVVVGTHLSMIRLGLTGTFLGVTLIHTVFALPYAIRIMTNVFEIVGQDLEQQATVLGAGKLLIFMRITLPRLMPGILAAGILGFTVSISQFITTFMIGGGRIITVTMLLVPHIRGGETQITAVYSVLLLAAALLSLVLTEAVVRRYYNFRSVYNI